MLDTQKVAVSQFVRNTGVVLNALTARQGQLASLIRNSNAVFQTTARRNQDLRALFLVLPTFLDESRLTLNRLDRFAANTNPLDHPASPGRPKPGAGTQGHRSSWHRSCGTS